MTALKFQATLSPDGMLKVPSEVATKLKDISTFEVVLLVPDATETLEEEDEAWDRMTEAELFRGYSDSDSIYDDV